MEWDWAFDREIMPTLIKGAIITVQATILGSIVAMAIGLMFAIARRSPNRLIARPIGFVVEFIRGPPLLVQPYFLFYVLHNIGTLLPPITAGVIALGVHYGT